MDMKDMSLKPVQIEFELESICPLKMDKWLDDPQPKNEQGYINLAKKKCYLDAKDYVSIPTASIKASMRNASSEVGRKMESKKNKQTIKSAIFFDEEFLPIAKEYDTIVRDIVTRGTGDKVTRVPTFRPLIRNWKCKGTMNLFGVPESFARECLELAGLRYGLLAHRPEFGRFIVKTWRVAK